VITTAGGPTDEFCPPQAGWRIRSRRAEFPSNRVDSLDTVGRPWMLEPDVGHLVELLREAAGSAEQRQARGQAGVIAATELGWDVVAARYAERIAALAERVPQHAGRHDPEPYPLDGGALRVLATPAWRGSDRLGELLVDWSGPEARASGATLFLLADPNVDGRAADLEAHVLAAAQQAGVNLDDVGDINILMEPAAAERDVRLHAAINAYVVLHPGTPGHERLGAAAGRPVLEPGTGDISRLLESALVVVA
jgi:hypothetical protein